MYLCCHLNCVLCAFEKSRLFTNALNESHSICHPSIVCVKCLYGVCEREQNIDEKLNERENCMTARRLVVQSNRTDKSLVN